MTNWSSIINKGKLYGDFKPKRKKSKRPKVPRAPRVDRQRTKSDGFYTSREWAEIRYQALLRNDGICELCGASKHEGAVLHVDHIKPRSKFPKLALVLSNLQVLCRTCNRGKSNKDDTDWRALDAKVPDEWAEIRHRLGEA